MVKRRRDYELSEHPRHQREWCRMYQVGDKIYKWHNPFTKAYIQDFNYNFGSLPLKRKLRLMWIAVRYSLHYYGPALNAEELVESEKQFNESLCNCRRLLYELVMES